MALNSDQAVRNATNKLLDIVAREQQAQSQYIDQLVRERDGALEEARKAKNEADAYKNQVQRYRSEANAAKQQLAKTHARFSLTLVPVHDTGEKRPGSSLHTPPRGGGPMPPGDITPSTGTASLSSNPDDTRSAPVPFYPTAQFLANQPHPRPVAPRQSPNTPKTWCYCKTQEYGTMVMCSNPSCPMQWFHVPCTGLVQVPEGEWTCKICNSSQTRPSK
ncbi:hypothetical protein BU17DRAFT_66448 [Hysterangium stoloniferum]|nr:hypothetical protein BU17DRAFT_66448 [Hysterangium stoloniferum]